MIKKHASNGVWEKITPKKIEPKAVNREAGTKRTKKNIYEYTPKRSSRQLHTMDGHTMHFNTTTIPKHFDQLLTGHHMRKMY